MNGPSMKDTLNKGPAPYSSEFPPCRGLLWGSRDCKAQQLVELEPKLKTGLCVAVDLPRHGQAAGHAVSCRRLFAT